MQISKFRIYKALIAVGLGIAVGIAIWTDTALVALIAVIAAISLAIILERGNREIVRDERIVQINSKASSLAFMILLILAAAAALATALFRHQLPESIVFAGTIMGYFTCAAVLLHFCFYIYFSRKL